MAIDWPRTPPGFQKPKYPDSPQVRIDFELRSSVELRTECLLKTEGKSIAGKDGKFNMIEYLEHDGIMTKFNFLKKG